MDNVPPPADNDQGAAASWPRTFRYLLIVLAERLPAALAALAALLAGRR